MNGIAASSTSHSRLYVYAKRVYEAVLQRAPDPIEGRARLTVARTRRLRRRLPMHLRRLRRRARRNWTRISKVCRRFERRMLRGARRRARGAAQTCYRTVLTVAPPSTEIALRRSVARTRLRMAGSGRRVAREFRPIVFPDDRPALMLLAFNSPPEEVSTRIDSFPDHAVVVVTDDPLLPMRIREGALVEFVPPHLDEVGRQKRIAELRTVYGAVGDRIPTLGCVGSCRTSDIDRQAAVSSDSSSDAITAGTAIEEITAATAAEEIAAGTALDDR